MSTTEATPLTEDTTARIFYVQDNNRFYSRRRREQRLQWLTFTVSLAIFTMALIVTIGFSMTLKDEDDDEATDGNVTLYARSNLTSNLKSAFQPANPWVAPDGSIYATSEAYGKNDYDAKAFSISEEERAEAIKAGNIAKENRLLADRAALANPLPSPSPELRHQYAISTSASVGPLALAAVAELAATKQIENSRSASGKPSSLGTFFDGGWAPTNTCKAFVQPVCEPIRRYRTYDGSCNRPKQAGAAMTPFRRILPSEYVDGLNEPRGGFGGKDLPSAREISLRVHPPASSNNPSFTVMLAVFGQFLDHDITATALSQGLNGSSLSCCSTETNHPECFPVSVSSGDPVYDVAKRTCMQFVRSAPAPQCKLGPREQLNQMSAFIDGSMIYGPNEETANSLREGTGGRLRMQKTPDGRTLLPPSLNPNDGCNRELEKERGRYCFAAGDGRANENLHLTTMHLIWARQHNKLADELAELNPTWEDEKLYQEARRIVGAQLQHITYNEFLPIVLGEDLMKIDRLAPLEFSHRRWIDNFDDPKMDPSIANSFASAAFRFAHTLLPGLMRMTDIQNGTSSYVELHRMLFNPYSLYSKNGVENSVISATSNNIQQTSPHVTSELTKHLFEDPVGKPTIPCGLDLVSLNIQRGRDHGLPGYTKWKAFTGWNITSFADLEGYLDPQSLKEISTLYKSVHDIDLYTGALAEPPVNGGLIGSTFSFLIEEQFGRLQRGDRFWYEVPDEPSSFTTDQLQELRKTSLARIICDCSDGITHIQAKVMKSVNSTHNPIVLCEDIPGPSLKPWKEDTTVLNLKLSPLPVDWLELKKNINQTVEDIVKFVNSTKNTSSVDADWLAFRDNVNNSFADLRNKFKDLYPKPVTTLQSSIPKKDISTTDPAVYTDWIDFKSGISRWINDTIMNMGNVAPNGTEWIAFKQGIKAHFDDMKSQIDLLKAEIAAKANQSLKLSTSAEVGFDWAGLRDEIVSTLNDTINEINNTKPLTPGDPIWASYGDKIKDRFAVFREKINKTKSDPPKEQLIPDWVNFKTDIVNVVNGTVADIKDDIPFADPTYWISYKDKIASKFSQLKVNITNKKNATYSEFIKKFNLTASASAPYTSDFSEYVKVPLWKQTIDWADFQNKLNSSLNDVIQLISNNTPSTNDSAAWIIYEDSVKQQFADLNDQVDELRSELFPKFDWKSKSKSLKLKSAKPATAGYKAGETGFVIPKSEWVNFKNDINNTVSILIDSIKKKKNDTVADWTGIGDTFNSSFADLKNKIVSLRDELSNKTSTKKPIEKKAVAATTAIDWAKFQAKINATVDQLKDIVKNQNFSSINDVVNSISKARDELVNLKPTNLSLTAGANEDETTQSSGSSLLLFRFSSTSIVVLIFMIFVIC